MKVGSPSTTSKQRIVGVSLFHSRGIYRCGFQIRVLPGSLVVDRLRNFRNVALGEPNYLRPKLQCPVVDTIACGASRGSAPGIPMCLDRPTFQPACRFYRTTQVEVTSRVVKLAVTVLQSTLTGSKTISSPAGRLPAQALPL
jgi:hypothetical protein